MDSASKEGIQTLRSNIAYELQEIGEPNLKDALVFI